VTLLSDRYALQLRGLTWILTLMCFRFNTFTFTVDLCNQLTDIVFTRNWACGFFVSEKWRGTHEG